MISCFWIILFVISVMCELMTAIFHYKHKTLLINGSNFLQTFSLLMLHDSTYGASSWLMKASIIGCSIGLTLLVKSIDYRGTKAGVMFLMIGLFAFIISISCYLYLLWNGGLL